MILTNDNKLTDMQTQAEDSPDKNGPNIIPLWPDKIKRLHSINNRLTQLAM